MTSLVHLKGHADKSTLLCMALLTWKDGFAFFFHLTEVEQGSRQDSVLGLTGAEGLVEAGVGVVGVLPI